MRILHDNGAGGLAIVIPAPNYVAAVMKANPLMTEADVVAYIAQKDVPANVAHEIVEDIDVPTDRTFRDAWEHDTTDAPEKIRTNMVKAKPIAHEMRRAKRAEDFAPLDQEVMLVAGVEAAGAVAPKAMKDKAAAAETARQAIRDADAVKQTAIDAAATEAELKALVV